MLDRSFSGFRVAELEENSLHDVKVQELDMVQVQEGSLRLPSSCLAGPSEPTRPGLIQGLG